MANGMIILITLLKKTYNRLNIMRKSRTFLDRYSLEKNYISFIRAKHQMTFDLQTILVQDQTFHLSNHAQEVTQLLDLEYVHLTISLFGTKI
jgi:hypothetical protein